MRRLYCVGLAVLFTLGLLAVLSFFPWGPVKVVRVVGHSMEPTLRDGQLVVTVRIPPRLGSVVVARDYEGECIVKRVRLIAQKEMLVNGRWVKTGRRDVILCGDNLAVTDARRVYFDRIIGTVIWPRCNHHG